jgi:uncharacterized protein (TIGR01244 family)
MRTNMARLVALSAGILAAASFASAGVESIGGFYRVNERVAVGAQPTPDEVTALSAAGFNGIVNLREESELNDGPQSHAARDSGMQFVRVPLSSKDPSDAAVDKFLAVTDDESLYPVFIYCASGNRAAALWMVRRVLREGWSLADAEAEADRAGLKGATMRDFARDYVHRHAEKETRQP